MLCKDLCYLILQYKSKRLHVQYMFDMDKITPQFNEVCIDCQIL